MTIEEKNETLRDLGKCITEAKRYFDDGNDFFTVQSGAWRIEFDMISQFFAAVNTAEMREALIWMKERMNAAIHDGSFDCDEALEKIDAALSAPPRNCDVYKDFNKAVRTLADIRDWHDGKWNSERYCILASWLLADANCKGAEDDQRNDL